MPSKKVAPELLTPITDGWRCGKSRPNLAGGWFGRLTPVREAGRLGTKIYWECLCECGTTVFAQTHTILRAEQVSCGCFRTRPYGAAARRSLWTNYRNQAHKRGFEFALSLDEFAAIIQRDCFYCGAAPAQRYLPPNGFNGPCIYNGIDRVDNKGGYFTQNCVPCCGRCNDAKRAATYADFIDWIDRIAQRHQPTYRPR